LNNPIRTLFDLYQHGGVEVRTPDGSKNGASAADLPVLARTLMQADADVITFVSPVLFQRPELWEEHLRRVRANLGALRLLRRVIAATRLVAFLPALVVGYDDLRGPWGIPYFADKAEWAVLTGISLAALRVVALTGAKLLLKRGGSA
jgi:hypothetical protein